MAQTLFDKIWDAHLVARRADGRELIYIDRHVLHELHAPHAFKKLAQAQRAVRRPDLTFSVQDHTVSTQPGRDDLTNAQSTPFLQAMREGSVRNGIRLFDIDDPEQGISHVVAPELGMVLPGATHAVPDSHACTVGGLGALAFGCGTSELEHILATQVIALKRPKRMRVRVEGRLGPHVTAKDVALRIIAQVGIAGGRGHAVEFAGAAVRAMSIESRLTLCNLAIEMGARSGFVAPDETTFGWLAGRPFAPQGRQWDAALAHWGTLASDDDAQFDSEVVLDCGYLEPQITWGTDPSQVVGVGGRVPELAAPGQEAAYHRALDYMGLTPGMAVAGLPVHRVFIGSCTNSRLPDLEAAAAVVRGRHVAAGVVAMVVPGSSTVKREAEAAGLDRVFRAAGFFWGESGCSMCAGGNGDRGEAGERCVSTTNRNFEGRQGKGVRTHLVSPATAAATAIAGHIVDVRQDAGGSRLMQPFTTLTGVAVPLLQDDINTDQITPINRNINPDWAALLFANARKRPDGSADPDFPLNKPQFRRARYFGDRPQFRLRLLARRRRVGHDRDRHPLHRGAQLRRYLPGELPAERPAAGRARARRQRGVRSARARRRWRRSVHGRSAGPAHQRSRRARHRLRAAFRRSHAPHRRPRRYRAHPQACARDRGLRSAHGRRTTLAADRSGFQAVTPSRFAEGVDQAITEEIHECQEEAARADDAAGPHPDAGGL